MRHCRMLIDQVSVSGRALDTVGGDLLVVDHEEQTGLDWELVCRTRPGTDIDMAPHHIEMDGPDGKLAGPALLVRSDGRSHVFRGAGELRRSAGPFAF